MEAAAAAVIALEEPPSQQRRSCLAAELSCSERRGEGVGGYRRAVAAAKTVAVVGSVAVAGGVTMDVQYVHIDTVCVQYSTIR